MKHPTDVGELRKEHFRSFLEELFPYYDAFKGNIFGKSCDFILADNKSHPKLWELVNKKKFYPYVFKSLVDTVIDLKSTYSKQSLNEGIEQAFKIKSFVRDEKVQRGVTESFNTPKDYLGKMTIKHGVIFIKGKSDKILVDIMDSCLSSKWIKYSSQIMEKFVNNGLLPMEEKQTQKSIKKREEFQKILFDFERFYKLPDFFYFIENDSFILINKGKIWHGFKHDSLSERTSVFSIEKFNNNALPLLLATIKMFSNERDNFQLKCLFHLEISKITRNFQSLSFDWDKFLTNENKWIVEHKFKDPYSPNLKIISDLKKLLNLKVIDF